MDSMKTFFTKNEKKGLSLEKTKLAIVSGGLTKIFQPLDLCINWAFKSLHVSQMSAKNHTITKRGLMHKATYTEVWKWILNSWNKILKDMIEKASLTLEISDFSQKSTDGGLLMIMTIQIWMSFCHLNMKKCSILTLRTRTLMDFLMYKFSLQCVYSYIYFFVKQITLIMTSVIIVGFYDAR